MEYSPEGYARTKSFEGLRLEAYKLPGDVFTIGYGHTGHSVVEGMKITPNVADLLLKTDIQVAEKAVAKYVTVPLNQHQFDALVDFVFNLGGENFRTSTLLKYVNAGKFDFAADEFTKWDHLRGRVLAGLLTRRTWERTYFAAPLEIVPGSMKQNKEVV